MDNTTITAEQIICKFISNFIDENWDNILDITVNDDGGDKPYQEGQELVSKESLVKDTSVDVELAMWILDEVCRNHMVDGKEYLREIYTKEGEWVNGVLSAIIKIDDVYIEYTLADVTEPYVFKIIEDIKNPELFSVIGKTITNIEFNGEVLSIFLGDGTEICVDEPRTGRKISVELFNKKQ